MASDESKAQVVIDAANEAGVPIKTLRVALKEPRVIINGHVLTEAESMCLRVAVTIFHGQVNASNPDDIGAKYKARCEDILIKMNVITGE